MVTPRVIEIRRFAEASPSRDDVASATDRAASVLQSSQRELVLQSLVRCPARRGPTSKR